MYDKRRKYLVWVLAVILLLAQTVIASPLLAQQDTGTDRISGADRYKTAAAISQKGWKTSDYAVLARGDNFADALCAGPLAQKYGGPILLTPSNELNSETLNELKRLGVKHLFITGGVGAVSQRVEDALKANGITTIERIYGTDRYETSVKIAEKIGNSSKLVLATGSDFPDALSISGIASKMGMPILLTTKDSLPKAVKNYFQANTVTCTYIVGGTAVIGTEVADSVPAPFRLAGSDRYATNKAVMENFESDLNFESIYVAIGSQFADALTGAVLAAKTSSPLVLTGKILPPGTADYLQTKLQLSTKVRGLGGKLVVPSSVLTGLMAAKQQISVKEKYSTAGTYGPETGTKTIQGSVIISAPDVTLRNTIIEGDLLLGSSIGDGEVTLRDVTVQGKTIINGGGPNSVIMYNFNGVTVTVDVPDGSSVRLVAQGNTTVANVSMEGNGMLQEAEVTGSGFVTVAIPQGAQVVLNGDFNEVTVEGGASVNVTGGSIATMNIAENAAGASVNLGNGSSVGTLNANAPSSITGAGQITTANVNVDDVAIQQTPSTTNMADGVTGTVGGNDISGNNTASSGSDGSSGTSSSYTVTYDGNGSTGGSVPVDAGAYTAGATVTVRGNTGTLVKTGFVFSGWNTAAAGNGTNRAAASTFAMGTGNVTLYAKWLSSNTTVSSKETHYNITVDASSLIPADNPITDNTTQITTDVNVGTFLGNLNQPANSQWKVFANANNPLSGVPPVDGIANFNSNPSKANTDKLANHDLLFVLAQDGATLRGYHITVATVPVVDFTSTAMTDTTVTFTWTAAAGATSVKIQKSPHGAGTWTDATTSAALNQASTTGTVTGLTASTAYDFKLVVTGGSKAGDSNVVSNIQTMTAQDAAIAEINAARTNGNASSITAARLNTATGQNNAIAANQAAYQAAIVSVSNPALSSAALVQSLVNTVNADVACAALVDGSITCANTAADPVTLVKPSALADGSGVTFAFASVNDTGVSTSIATGDAVITRNGGGTTTLSLDILCTIGGQTGQNAASYLVTVPAGADAVTWTKNAIAGNATGTFTSPSAGESIADLNTFTGTASDDNQVMGGGVVIKNNTLNKYWSVTANDYVDARSDHCVIGSFTDTAGDGSYSTWSLDVSSRTWEYGSYTAYLRVGDGQPHDDVAIVNFTIAAP